MVNEEKKKLRKDTITEMQYGDGAIRTCGKILLSDIGREGADFDKTLVLGVIAENLLSESNIKRGFYEGEMWEAELIIIPRRKFMGHKEGMGWDGLDTDQKLGSDWANKNRWKKCVELQNAKN